MLPLLSATTVSALLNGLDAMRGSKKADRSASLVLTPVRQSSFHRLQCFRLPLVIAEQWITRNEEGGELINEFVASGGLNTALGLILSPLPCREPDISGWVARLFVPSPTADAHFPLSLLPVHAGPSAQRS